MITKSSSSFLMCFLHIVLKDYGGIMCHKGLCLCVSLVTNHFTRFWCSFCFVMDCPTFKRLCLAFSSVFYFFCVANLKLSFEFCILTCVVSFLCLQSLEFSYVFFSYILLLYVLHSFLLCVLHFQVCCKFDVL